MCRMDNVMDKQTIITIEFDYVDDERTKTNWIFKITLKKNLLNNWLQQEYLNFENVKKSQLYSTSTTQSMSNKSTDGTRIRIIGLEPFPVHFDNIFWLLDSLVHVCQ